MKPQLSKRRLLIEIIYCFKFCSRLPFGMRQNCAAMQQFRLDFYCAVHILHLLRFASFAMRNRANVREL